MKDWSPDEIKKLRSLLKLSQRKFAALVGVSEQYIYYLERGERQTSKTLKLLLGYIERDLKERR